MKTKPLIPKILLTVLLLSIPSILCLPTCFAQNYTKMGLPKDAKARLGKGRIQQMLYSPDGNTFTVVTSIGIWLHDAKTYQEIALIPIPIRKNYTIYPKIKNFTYSVDGQTLFSKSDNDYYTIWDTNTGESRLLQKGSEVFLSTDRMTLNIKNENKTIQLYQEPKNDTYFSLIENKEDIVSFTFSPDGKTFAATDDKYSYAIRIEDTRTRKLKKRLTGFSEFIFIDKVALSPDGQTLAILRSDHPIHLWDVASGKLENTFTGYKVPYRTNHNLNQARYQPSTLPDCVAFSPDGNSLATGNRHGTIQLWNNKTAKLRRKWVGHQGFVNSLAFSPDGKLLASGGEEGIVFVWNLDTYTHNAFLAERIAPISYVTFSRDGSLLASGNKDGNIHIFEVTTGNPILTLTGHSEEIYQILFSPIGDTIASSSWDGSVRLWDIQTGTPKITLSSPKELLWGELLFTDNGKLIAIRCHFEHIHLWDVTHGQYEKISMGHTSFIRDLSLSADRQTLASASADGTILVWDLSSITNTTD